MKRAPAPGPRCQHGALYGNCGVVPCQREWMKLHDPVLIAQKRPLDAPVDPMNPLRRGGVPWP